MGEKSINMKKKYELIDAFFDRKSFEYLFNVYLSELSVYSEWLSESRDENGIFLPGKAREYFEDKTKTLFVIYYGENPVGLVVFSEPDREKKPEECDYYIEEIYIEKSCRGYGICSDIVRQFWKTHPGICGVCVHKNNKEALWFWKNMLKKEGYEYQKIKSDDIWFFGIFVEEKDVG